MGRGRVRGNRSGRYVNRPVNDPLVQENLQRYNEAEERSWHDQSFEGNPNANFAVSEMRGAQMDLQKLLSKKDYRSLGLPRLYSKKYGDDYSFVTEQDRQGRSRYFNAGIHGTTTPAEAAGNISINSPYHPEYHSNQIRGKIDVAMQDPEFRAAANQMAREAVGDLIKPWNKNSRPTRGM